MRHRRIRGVLRRGEPGRREIAADADKDHSRLPRPAVVSEFDEQRRALRPRSAISLFAPLFVQTHLPTQQQTSGECAANEDDEGERCQRKQ